MPGAFPGRMRGYDRALTFSLPHSCKAGMGLGVSLFML